MVDILNFIFLLAGIILLSIGLVIAEGQISELKGKVDSLLIAKEDSNDKKSSYYMRPVLETYLKIISEIKARRDNDA